MAPRCFAVVERPAEEYWLWLEEVSDEFGPQWPLEHYGVVAGHLGQFNGAYLTGEPIPSQPWLSRGWLREHVAQAAPGIAMLCNSLKHPLVRRTFPADVADGVLRLWAEREALLDVLNSLPRAFCHLDAFRRNLFARRGADGRHRTVAIDWCYVGTGVIGEEIAPLVSGGFLFGDVDLEKALDLDTYVFDGYVEGLRRAGWRGDRRMVRFVYTAASALRYGIGYPQLELPVLLDESRHAGAEQLMGRPLEEAADLGAEGRRFLLGLADEARGLMDTML